MLKMCVKVFGFCGVKGQRSAEVLRNSSAFSSDYGFIESYVSCFKIQPSIHPLYPVVSQGSAGAHLQLE